MYFSLARLLCFCATLLTSTEVFAESVEVLQHFDFTPESLYQMPWEAQRWFWRVSLLEASAIINFTESQEAECNSKSRAVQAFMNLTPKEKSSWIGEDEMYDVVGYSVFDDVLKHIRRHGGFNDASIFQRHYCLLLLSTLYRQN